MELKQFKITVVPLRDKLLNYARRMTDDPSDAEDAVQEVMLKLWNLRQKLDEYRSIEAVAMTMTHHLCMDLWRAKRPDTLSLDRVQAPTPSATPERLLEEKDEFRLTSKSTKRKKLPKSPDAMQKPFAAICQEPARK